MPEQTCTYAILGAGLTGASAVKGIRERDESGSILLIGSEEHLPYDRPPLSKDLWSGKKQLEEITLGDEAFYADKGVDLVLGATVVGLDAGHHTVTDDQGRSYRYEKLLLATGGAPRRLDVPGGDLDGVCYYRTLDDYQRIRAAASQGRSALVVGGGFIGSEMAAALNMNGLDVTMVFPDPYLCRRVFPESLARAIQAQYRERGIEVLAGDAAASFERAGDRYVARTSAGQEIAADIVIAGIGLAPSTALAKAAGLEVANGIVVNDRLQTSHPDVYAAGDNAHFPYQALGKPMRIEHWDNARKQGKHAGLNLAGADEPFVEMPYFYSDLFEFGYEAVGEADARLETFLDWKKENDTGVIYYLQDEKVRGVMLCNVWKRLKAARELIRSAEAVAPEDLRGAIQ